MPLSDFPDLSPLSNHVLGSWIDDPTVDVGGEFRSLTFPHARTLPSRNTRLGMS